ncbi:tetratricopeptide repeat protein [Streptomyces sp. NPDC049040]|uniref:tetratricopeptide repeat protein n=1 Tax=Streptomyces sp. NPDC049040 TaxID=3365593 RepID=UPI00372049BF
MAAATSGGVAAARDIGQVNQHTHLYGAVRALARLPHQVGVIPPRAGSFQDRSERARLGRDLTDTGGAAPAQPSGSDRVLVGMGGVGKTQLAADHARTAWTDGELDLLVWITASSRAAVIAGLARAGTDLLGTDAGDPDAAAAAFLAWLEPKAAQPSCRWLIVLDDLADPADMAGLWPPAGPTGRVLVTTRRRDAAMTVGGRRRIDVGLFTPADAIAYLATALAEHGRTETREDLAALAEQLGHLPLALSQAAAYMSDTAMTSADYRRLLADRTATLVDAAPDALPDGQTRPAAAAWHLSLERADAMRPSGLARPLLHLAAFLDPNGIPETVLTSAPALSHLTGHRTPDPAGGRPDGAGPPVTAAQAGLALRVLHRLSLIDHTPADTHRAVRVHALVQRTTRDTLTAAQREDSARAAADALLTAWPDIERDTDLTQSLRFNAATLVTHARSALVEPRAHPLLFRHGRSLSQCGQVNAAFRHFEGVAEATRRFLGPDDPDTMAATHELALCQGQAGDAAGARDAFAALLDDRRRVLGPDHPDTLDARSELAFWQAEAGDVIGAVKAFAALLDDRRRVLGPDHRDTLTTRSNLAYTQSETGNAADAVEAFTALLEDRTRVLGADHPDTLMARHQVVFWQARTSAREDFEAAFSGLLADYVRVLGPDHPNTLTTRGNIAHRKGEQGDATGAVTAYAELLADQQRVLGPDHPDTLSTRAGLAYWRGRAGDATGAVTAYTELLADRQRVLGPDHPDTLTTRAGLAHWYGETGDMARVISAYAELLADRQRVLGPDHPDTLTTRNNLAHWRGRAGDATGAATAYAELLADRERVLGPDHPHTRITRSNLFHWQRESREPPGNR